MATPPAEVLEVVAPEAGAKKWPKKSVPSLPKDYVVDKDARYPGTVISYAKWQGYGFIKPDQDGLVPEDKVWVHWSNIQTEDRFPFLTKDMKVEFGLMIWTSGKGEWEKTSLRAKTVTEVGGAAIAVQEKVDAEKKEFLDGKQQERYAGMLKFYVPRQGYGYVTLDSQLKDAAGEEVPKELRVEEPEVNCGGKRPTTFIENQKVEFGIVKNKKGQYMIYNMTLPGGTPLSKANLENRQLQGDQEFRGTISHFHWRQAWGFIVPETTSFLPPNVQQALTKQQEEAKEKSKKEEGPSQVFYFTKADVANGTNLKSDTKVVFKVYLDDKGVGAYDVAVVDGAETL